jgi:hypothetical protein
MISINKKPLYGNTLFIIKTNKSKIEEELAKPSSSRCRLNFLNTADGQEFLKLINEVATFSNRKYEKYDNLGPIRNPDNKITYEKGFKKDDKDYKQQFNITNQSDDSQITNFVKEILNNFSGTTTHTSIEVLILKDKEDNILATFLVKYNVHFGYRYINELSQFNNRLTVSNAVSLHTFAAEKGYGSHLLYHASKYLHEKGVEIIIAEIYFPIPEDNQMNQMIRTEKFPLADKLEQRHKDKLLNPESNKLVKYYQDNGFDIHSDTIKPIIWLNNQVGDLGYYNTLWLQVGSSLNLSEKLQKLKEKYSIIQPVIDNLIIKLEKKKDQDIVDSYNLLKDVDSSFEERIKSKILDPKLTKTGKDGISACASLILEDIEKNYKSDSEIVFGCSHLTRTFETIKGIKEEFNKNGKFNIDENIYALACTQEMIRSKQTKYQYDNEIKDYNGTIINLSGLAMDANYSQDDNMYKESLNLFNGTNDPDNILVKLLKYENSKVEGFNPEINWDFYHETMTKLRGSQYNCKDKPLLDVITDFNAYLTNKKK